ncbi:hypothetical protein BT96DRAFT_939463 [Gymnopus androsaceus JB14]|uniref:Uncharacterized protein n=1 Tax=Gymnopus androsaceus JB14 TaxID=1447944 RepID=A0A6A4HRL7_9AGAR|nr:hypothetical protein BT96DRAFT_939463 [Gymnopus androsaceus JB14]
MSQKVLFLEKSKGAFVVADAPILKPDPGQWIQAFGFFVQKYPAILGTDIAGDRLGSAVLISMTVEIEATLSHPELPCLKNTYVIQPHFLLTITILDTQATHRIYVLPSNLIIYISMDLVPSDPFLRDLHRLYSQNATQNVASLVDLSSIEKQTSNVTVTNSLLFSGNMRMQGITRDILKKEHSLLSFHDLMNCVPASSSKPVLAKISRQFSSDILLCLAGKPNNVLSNSLLENICRALVTGTGDVYNKHAKSVKITLGSDPYSSSLDLAGNSLHTHLTRIITVGPQWEIESYLTTIQFLGLSISKRDVGVQTVAENDLNASKTLTNLDIPKFFLCSYVPRAKKRARAASASVKDENTPPSKKHAPIALKTPHRRFASMPLQMLSGNNEPNSRSRYQRFFSFDGLLNFSKTDDLYHLESII